ncbi:MAG TPA: hypothetical protein VJ957_01895 [Longimicrobiales bacterium]|nr:hypothetical protein [Longimicrobiales bacterium]
MGKNPFEDVPSSSKRNPFGDEDQAGAPATPEEAIGRIEESARRIRLLRSRMGAEGLTLSATRELIDHLALALDAAARVLRDIHD